MEHDPLLPESKPVPPSPSLGDRIARIFLPNRHSKEKEKEVSKQLEPDVSKTESPASEKSAPTSSPSQHADNKEPLKDVRVSTHHIYCLLITYALSTCILSFGY